jgi:hypothetical protein
MLEDSMQSRPDRTVSKSDERNRRRSERVVLRVPLQLSAKLPDGKRISIEAHTLIVNVHGGLLDVGIEMVRGQQMILNNSRMAKVASGKVLRVEKSEEGRFSVAFEFDIPTPCFWPVSFPPADWSSIEAAV